MSIKMYSHPLSGKAFGVPVTIIATTTVGYTENLQSTFVL